MRFSRFTPMGLFRFKGGTPIAKRIYDDQIRALGGADGDLHPVPGTYLEAHAYASSIEIAFAKRRLEVAKNQALPSKVTDLLPNREVEYGIVPTVGQSDEDRRTELARRALLPIAPTQANIEGALTDMLDTDFIAYRPTPATEAFRYPTNVGDAPESLQRPEVTRKVVRLGSAVSFIGTPSTVPYEMIDLPQSPSGTVNTALVSGDVLVFDPGHSTADRVTVASVTNDGHFTATFSQPHMAGSCGYTQPLPSQTSSKRQVLVVLSDTAAADPEKRRRVHDYLARTVRATTGWRIAAGTSSGTTPFNLATSAIPYTSVTTVTLP